NGGLHENGTAIKVLIHKVSGASGDFHAVYPCLILRIETRKSRQQRRVNVQNAIAELVDKMAAEQAHVSGKADKVDGVLAQEIRHLAVVFVAVDTLRFESPAGKAEFAGQRKPGGVGAIRKNEANFAIEITAEYVSGDSFEVRAAAGEKDAQIGFQREPRRRKRRDETAGSELPAGTMNRAPQYKCLRHVEVIDKPPGAACGLC